LSRRGGGVLYDPDDFTTNLKTKRKINSRHTTVQTLDVPKRRVIPAGLQVIPLASSPPPSQFLKLELPSRLKCPRPCRHKLWYVLCSDVTCAVCIHLAVKRVCRRAQHVLYGTQSTVYSLYLPTKGLVATDVSRTVHVPVAA
jgi:hypothetical protein